MAIDASAGIVRESVHARIKELCRLLVPSTRDGAADGKVLRRATTTAYERLLFWDGGEEMPEEGRRDADVGGAHVLDVAAGVYAMRCSGRQQDADRLEQLLMWLSPSFADKSADSAGRVSPQPPAPDQQRGRDEPTPIKRAVPKFLPPGVRQDVIQLDNVDAVLSALMLLRGSANVTVMEYTKLTKVSSIMAFIYALYYGTDF
jgi:hypothetical protein